MHWEILFELWPFGLVLLLIAGVNLWVTRSSFRRFEQRIEEKRKGGRKCDG